MNRVFNIIINIIIVLFTILVVVIKPTLHKPPIIVSEKYAFIDEQKEKGPEIKKVIKVEPKKTIAQSKPSQKVSKPIKKESKPVSTSKNQQVKTQKSVEIKKEVPIVEQKTETKVKSEEKPIIENDLAQKEEQKSQSQDIKTLTEEEEIIAWNKWRSDLQNQVMKDTNISAPIGIAFKFSFTVDKFGNISNVKVWSTTPAYSDMAVKAIKPVLMSYQNTALLNFPQGTKRVITNVAGGFIMSDTTGYSSPSDYSDYERIKK